MIKYMFKVYDENEKLIIQTTVPAEEMFSVLKELRQFGVVKAYLLDSDVSA